jgi:methyl-accepting chemotaxis protein
MPPADSPRPTQDHRQAADRLMLGALVLYTLVAMAIGSAYDQMGTALAVGLPLLVVGALAVRVGAGSTVSSIVVGLVAMAMVALHIQLGRGTVEFHFGVFATLALLQVYRDWRPIVAAAGLIAAHHVVFDRLQAAGVGVYCMAEPNFAFVLLHAGYVVGQTAIQVVMALQMGQAARQGEELARIVGHLSGQGGMALDVGALDLRTTLARHLRDVLLRLNEAMVSVRDTASQIHLASGEIAAGNADLSRRTESAASSLQQTASSMEQLTSAVSHNAGSASTANQLAGTAAEAAQKGGSVVQQVVANMDELSAQSRRIADIIGVIDGIAFQTNILALNAAVEAARAGEQGRGFAVVAGEVRSLAQRCTEAAREIKSLIGTSVQTVESGAQLVRDAGATMEAIVASVQRVSDVIGEITHATAEQSGGIGHVNRAVTELDQMTQQNAALVEQSSAAAESLKQHAGRLHAAVSGFRLQSA